MVVLNLKLCVVEVALDSIEQQPAQHRGCGKVFHFCSKSQQKLAPPLVSGGVGTLKEMVTVFLIRVARRASVIIVWFVPTYSLASWKEIVDEFDYKFVVKCVGRYCTCICCPIH